MHLNVRLCKLVYICVMQIAYILLCSAKSNFNVLVCAMCTDAKRSLRKMCAHIFLAALSKVNLNIAYIVSGRRRYGIITVSPRRRIASSYLRMFKANSFSANSATPLLYSVYTVCYVYEHMTGGNYVIPLAFTSTIYTESHQMRI